MRDPIWISIRDNKIVGTPFGPDVPNGKYLHVEMLDSEGGDTPLVVETLCQYLDDLRHPPVGESIRRRIELVERVLRAFPITAAERGVK